MKGRYIKRTKRWKEKKTENLKKNYDRKRGKKRRMRERERWRFTKIIPHFGERD
jgi:hypothetical protein